MLKNTPNFTAIILNYKRPQNIEPIVRALSRTAFVEKIIVSNNNPKCNLNDWVDTNNTKLTLLHQEKRRSPAIRFSIAASDEAQYFIAVDDDIFLHPLQFNGLCRALVSDPLVPHGVFGQIRSIDGDLVSHVKRAYIEVDELNRVYLFTKTHMNEFFRLLDELKMSHDQAAWEHGMWDDILLSFSGCAKPLCHDVGPIRDCPTHSKAGIAVWRSNNSFFAYRRRFYRLISSIKNVPSRQF